MKLGGMYMGNMTQSYRNDNSLLILVLLLCCCQGSGPGLSGMDMDDMVFWLVLLMILGGGFGCHG